MVNSPCQLVTEGREDNIDETELSGPVNPVRERSSGDDSWCWSHFRYCHVTDEAERPS
jgi:hypothetical protein